MNVANNIFGDDQTEIRKTITKKAVLPIPSFLSHRPVYQGFPIPYNTMIVDGVPDFRTLDIIKVVRCMRHKICGICGKPIVNGWFAFIGGENSVTMRAFTDPPMHKDCAYFSAKACPFLNGTLRQYAKGETRTERNNPELIVKIDQELPKRMAIYLCKDYEVIKDPGAVVTQYVMICRPNKKPRVIDWDAMPAAG